VRETKGTLNLDALRFPGERRKIVCAKKRLDAVGIDYRPIKDDTSGWWRQWPTEELLGL